MFGLLYMVCSSSIKIRCPSRAPNRRRQDQPTVRSEFAFTDAHPSSSSSPFSSSSRLVTAPAPLAGGITSFRRPLASAPRLLSPPPLLITQLPTVLPWRRPRPPASAGSARRRRPTTAASSASSLSSPDSQLADGLNKNVSELFVECRLYIDGVQFGLPVNTRLESSGPPYCWNELITLCTKYRDLTSLAQLAFTVWDVSSGEGRSVVGGATIFLFNSKKQLKTGRQKLRLWPQKEADGRVPTTTPGKVPRNERGEVEQLERLVNKYERGQIQHVDWLDCLVFGAVDRVKEKECEKLENSFPSLVVEFCSFEHRVVFQESGANFYAPAPVSLSNELVTVWDPELGRTNPSEHKQLKLARSLTRGIIDKDLKPSSNERKFLQRIIKYPPTRAIQADERQVLWKFRFSLMSEKKALTKFVRSVDWSYIQEAKQAVELIGKWETIDVADALELLSPDFKSDEVRAYAVSVLERADDEELQCYLLQLVQALRYERSDKSRLAQFLVNRALSNIEIASFLRWYVVVELHDHAHARRYYSTYDMLEDEMMKMVAREDGDEDGFRLWQSRVYHARQNLLLNYVLL
uniref:Uncharacterized protein n=1 Tax=Avena sativa TaxID=4498 RepID=A0ACD5X4Y6_AVESA